jgi:uncharacterized membrane protein
VSLSALPGSTAYTERRSVRRLGQGLRRRRRLRVGLTQLSYVLVGVAAGLLVPRIHVWFTVSRDETAQMLFAVGAGLIPFIGVVFSLLFLVVQFGSTAFTPRLNLFHSSPVVWHAFGFYMGMIVYSFAAAFSLGRRDAVTGLVPIITVMLLLVAVILFRALQMRAFSSIQLGSTLAQVTQRGRRVLDGVYPDRPLNDGEKADPHGLPPGRHEITWSDRPGVIQAVDVPRIIAGTREDDAVVEFVVAIGETIQRQAPVAVVHGAADAALDTMVRKAIRTGAERTFEQDPTLPFRVLADIALRALSSGINDPTTAVQVIDSEEGLLRMLVARDLDVGEITGPRGNIRVLLPLPSWGDYVGLAVDELIDMGAQYVQVRRRLDRLLRDLLALAPPSRRAPLQIRLDCLASGCFSIAGFDTASAPSDRPGE